MASILERQLERAIWWLDPARRAEVIGRRRATRKRHEDLGLIPVQTPEQMRALGSRGGIKRAERQTPEERHALAVYAGQARGAQIHAAAEARKRDEHAKVRRRRARQRARATAKQKRRPKKR